MKPSPAKRKKHMVILQNMILKDRLEAIRCDQEELKATLHRLNNLPPPPNGGGEQWLDWSFFGIGLLIIAFVALSICGWCW